MEWITSYTGLYDPDKIIPVGPQLNDLLFADAIAKPYSRS